MDNDSKQEELLRVVLYRPEIAPFDAIRKILISRGLLWRPHAIVPAAPNRDINELQVS
jgi:hypothetical protein